MMKIFVKDFTKFPGPRYEAIGTFSGERFRNEVLLPKFQEANQNSEKLVIDLDGTHGYGSSFLEEAFGGAVRENLVFTKDNLEFYSQEDGSLIEEIWQYIEEAKP